MGLLLARELDRLEVEMNEVVSVRTFYVAASLVKHDVGVAVVDEFTARATMTPDLHFNRLSPPIAFGVFAIWLEERPPSRACQKFIEVLTSLIPENSSK
jgi:DNA-binding transcriptional LysR family regulator